MTERFRCHSLASGQVRCQGFASGRFRCFRILSRLCGQVGCWGYKVVEQANQHSQNMIICLLAVVLNARMNLH